MDYLILESYEQSKGNWIIRVFLDEKTTVFLHYETEGGDEPTQEKVNLLMEKYLDALKEDDLEKIKLDVERENGSQN